MNRAANIQRTAREVGRDRLHALRAGLEVVYQQKVVELLLVPVPPELLGAEVFVEQGVQLQPLPARTFGRQRWTPHEVLEGRA